MERFAYEISWYTRISALTFLVCESAKMEVELAEHTHTRARARYTLVPCRVYNFRNALLG